MNLPTGICVIKFKSAFNNVWSPVVPAELCKTDCKANLYKLTKSFLNDRKISYIKIGATIKKVCSRGCPQSSNFESLLWNVVNNSALQLQLRNSIYIHEYSDDFIAIVADNTKYGAEQ